MKLPEVFAIYRHNTQTFQLIQPQENDGTIVLKSWIPPSGENLRILVEKDKKEASLWLNGQEWFVQPYESNQKSINIEIYKTNICNKTYYWWPLHYRLVWSNYEVHSRRFTIGAETWYKSPSIPIIEFSRGVVFPRVVYGFYPRWTSTKPRDIELVSYSSRACLEQDSDYENEMRKNLRITTPRAREELDLDDDSWYGQDDNSTCVTSVSLLVMILAFTGLYTYLVAQSM